MGQVFSMLENIAPLVRASSTTITMASTYLGMPVRISVGGQQYKATGTITLNTAASPGINALDTGSLVANTLYYIYAVQSSGVLGLVASTTASTTGPTGFTAWKEIGRFRTDVGAANVNTVVNRLISAGPGQIINTKSTGPWQSFTPIWTTLGTLSANAGNWRQIDDSMEFEFSATQSGATSGAGTLLIAVPDSKTIHTTKVSALGLVSFGSGAWYNIDATDLIPGVVVYNSTTNIALAVQGPGGNYDALDGADIDAGDQLFFRATIPIAEWAGLFD